MSDDPIDLGQPQQCWAAIAPYELECIQLRLAHAKYRRQAHLTWLVILTFGLALGIGLGRFTVAPFNEKKFQDALEVAPGFESTLELICVKGSDCTGWKWRSKRDCDLHEKCAV